MRRSSHLFAALLVLACAGPAPVLAGEGDLRWDAETDRNSFTLVLRHKDPKAPLPFVAACEDNGDLKLTIGAPLDKVQKAGEPVTIKLDAGGKSASISGKAQFNEFTKAMELRLETNVDNPVFGLLETGKPVQLTRPATVPMTWPAIDPDKVKLWVTDCRFRSEH